MLGAIPLYALAWIAGNPTHQKPFVSNRTAKILSIIPAKNWYHVKGEENPADLISHGSSPQDLQNNLAWEGPSWLTQFNHFSNELRELHLSPTELAMRVKQKSERSIFVTINNYSNQLIFKLLNNYSSLSRIERILAIINRFLSNCRLEKSRRFQNAITLQEIQVAHRTLIKQTQQLYFAEKLK